MSDRFTGDDYYSEPEKYCGRMTTSLAYTL